MIKIIQATENDISIIEDIMLDVVDFLDSIKSPQWERKNATWKGLSKYFTVTDFYIAYLDNVPLGCMALVDYDPFFWPNIKKGESLFIHKLAVKRIGAKKGISKALIDFAKEKSIDLDINSVRLDSHQSRLKVRKIYEKEGFICVEERCLFDCYHTAFYEWEKKND